MMHTRQENKAMRLATRELIGERPAVEQEAAEETGEVVAANHTNGREGEQPTGPQMTTVMVILASLAVWMGFWLWGCAR